MYPTRDTLPNTPALEITPRGNDQALQGLLIPPPKLRGYSDFSEGSVSVLSTSDPGINLQRLFSVHDIHPGGTQVARC